MIKKFLSGFAMASVMLATSCSNGQFDEAGSGNEATVSFTAQLPSGLQIKTRAFGNGTTAKELSYAVYDKDWGHLSALDGKKDINMSTTVDFRLVNGKTYNIVFWADNENAPYTFDKENFTLTANYDNITSSDEKLDAFFHVERELTVGGAISKNISLKRPFAQVNIGTADLEAAAKAGINIMQAGITVDKIYTKLNFQQTDVVVTTEGDNSIKENFTFGEANLPSSEKFPVDGYDYLTMNYLFMPVDKETVNITINYNSAAEPRLFSSIPVQRNYRTNIYGNLITSTEEFNVTVNPEFNSEDENKVVSDIKAALQNGNHYTLTQDVNLGATQIVIPAGVTGAVLDLNGHKITADFSSITEDVATAFITVKKGADLTITGNGEIHFIDHPVTNKVSAMVVNEAGNVTIENGTYTMNDWYGGGLMWQISTFVDNNSGNGNANLTVNGGTFYHYNNIFRNFSNSSTAVATININGGNYTATDEKACIWNQKPSGSIPAGAGVVNINGGTFTNIVLEDDFDGGKETPLKAISSVEALKTALSSTGDQILVLTSNLNLDEQVALNGDVTLVLGGNDFNLDMSGLTEQTAGQYYTAIKVPVGKKLTINGDGNVHFEAYKTDTYMAAMIYNNAGIVDINGGTYTLTAGTYAEGYLIPCFVDNSSNVGEATLNINGGEFTFGRNLFRNHANSSAGATININGGIFNGAVGDPGAIWNQRPTLSVDAALNYGKINVNAGAFNGVSIDNEWSASAVTVAGGVIVAVNN